MDIVTLICLRSLSACTEGERNARVCVWGNINVNVKVKVILCLAASQLEAGGQMRCKARIAWVQMAQYDRRRYMIVARSHSSLEFPETTLGGSGTSFVC